MGISKLAFARAVTALSALAFSAAVWPETAIMLKDINPAGDSLPYGFRKVGGNVYFTANDEVSGVELWKTNGTLPGTQMVKDLLPGSGGGSASGFGTLGNLLVFAGAESAGDFEPHITDGTPLGTSLLRDINPGLDSSTYLSYPVEVGSHLYFEANDGPGGSGYEVWRTDGTGTGTELFLNLNGTSDNSNPILFKSLGQLVIVPGFGPDTGDLLYCNAACQGNPLTNPPVNIAGIDGEPICSIGTDIGAYHYFAGFSAAAGNALWRTDGTEAGTQLMVDFHPSTDFNEARLLLAPADSKLIIQTEAPAYGSELWVLDTTQPVSPGPTYDTTTNPRVIDVAPGIEHGSFAKYLLPGGNRVYYVNGTTGIGVGVELWTFDVTQPISAPPYTSTTNPHYVDINPGSADSMSFNSGSFGLDVNGILYFVANDGVHGFELWKSNGTAAGTQLVQDIFPGSDSGFGNYFAFADNKLYFAANDGTHGNEPWVIDFGGLLSARFAPPVLSGKSTSNTPVPEGPAGSYQFTSKFCLTPGPGATGLFSRTAQLTNNNSLISRSRPATSGPPGGVGSEQDFAANLGYSDGVLSGGECTNVLYKIGLYNTSSFSFRVNLFGDVVP